MTLNLAVNLTSQSASIVALRGCCWLVLCWRVMISVVVGVSVSLVVLPCGRAGEDDEDVVLNVGERQYVFTEEQFDKMVFGNPRARGNQVIQVVQGAKGNQQIVVSVQPAEMDFQKRMNAAVTVEIQAIHGRLLLTDSQKKKLNLAAHGDIAKLFDLVAELRPKMTSKPLRQDEYVVLMDQLQPFRTSREFGIIREDSLFRKTLRGILTDEQRVLWQSLQRERQKATIEAALQNTERSDMSFKLRGETRTKFIELILDHGQLPQSVGPFGQWIVILEANVLRDRVRLLLDDDEWNQFEWQVGQAKRYVPTLDNYGLWTARRSNDDDETAVDARKD